MTDALPDAETVRRSLIRRFLAAQLAGAGSPLIAAYPVEAAEVAMAVVGPLLAAKDEEIERLRAGLAAEECL